MACQMSETETRDDGVPGKSVTSRKSKRLFRTRLPTSSGIDAACDEPAG